MTRLVKRPEGRIDMDTAAGLTGWLDTEAAPGDVIDVDMSAISDADSAAIALLLEWQRRLSLRSVTLQVSGMPTGLMALTRLYGLEGVFLATGEPQA